MRLEAIILPLALRFMGTVSKLSQLWDRIAGLL